MQPEPSSDGPVRTTFNILFVCTGNTCRSPMAEAIARDELERRGWSHVRVASAGVAAEPGLPASTPAVSVLRRRNVDLSAHQSRPLDPELVDWADLILAMSPSHLRAVAALGGAERMALLGDFGADEGEVGRPVTDPYGGGEADYEATLLDLEALVHKSLDRLAPILHP